jgi:hypothetical protein
VALSCGGSIDAVSPCLECWAIRHVDCRGAPHAGIEAHLVERLVDIDVV